MAGLRFPDVQSRPTEFLDVTTRTLSEFQPLARPFEAALQAHMAAGCLDRKPRTACQFAVRKNGSLPRHFLIPASGKIAAFPVIPGRLFGIGLSKADPWIHILLPALLAALRPLGAAPLARCPRCRP